MKPILLMLCVLLWTPAALAGNLKVYGPGGPYPAMQAAAEAFQDLHPEVDIQIRFGPAERWLADAKKDADIIFSGSEFMMTFFEEALPEQILAESVYPLYLRPSAILVRPGNPKNIQGFRDLLRPQLKILVVNGAGQIGLWEDMAAKTGRIEPVRLLRKNIRYFAANSGVAKKIWQTESDLDAWIIWNHWQIANPQLADLVPVEPEFRIYRSCDLALTQQGQEKSDALAFVEFLRSAQGRAIFERFGWAEHF